MPPDVTNVVEQILGLLRESPNQSLLGSTLSGKLRARLPDFKAIDYGQRNLREFLRMQVPQVYEASRQGLDFIYTLSPVPVAPSIEPAAGIDLVQANVLGALRLDDAVWKTYVSPNSPYRLFINDTSSEFRVVGLREEAPQSPWKQVPPCPTARHRRIAEEFAAGQAVPELRAKLEQTLIEKVWWIPYFEETRRLGIEKQWLDYRRAGLFAELRKTLSILGVAPEKLEQLKRTPERRTFKEKTRTKVETSELRRAALEIVARVPDAELRELRFRLGDVLDALAKS